MGRRSVFAARTGSPTEAAMLRTRLSGRHSVGPRRLRRANRSGCRNPRHSGLFPARFQPAASPELYLFLEFPAFQEAPARAQQSAPRIEEEEIYRSEERRV